MKGALLRTYIGELKIIMKINNFTQSLNNYEKLQVLL